MRGSQVWEKAYDFLLLTDWHFSASGRWAEFPSDSGAGTLLVETR